MNIRKTALIRHIFLMASISFFFPAQGWAAEALSVEEAVREAVAANIDLKISRDGLEAAAAAKNSKRAEFLPSFGAMYRYQYNHEESKTTLTLPGGDVTLSDIPKSQFAFTASVTQPVFAGFALRNQYILAGLGLDAAKFNEMLVKRVVSYKARESFFSVLKAEKIVEIAKEAVALIDAHRDSAQNFYDVGMTPLNDLLKAQVELANARLDLVIAENALEMARADFNVILRRPIDSAVSILDTLDHDPFGKTLGECLEAAEKNRMEIKLAGLDAEMARKSLDVERAGFLPAVSLVGTYRQFGDDWNTNGGRGASDPSMWDVAVTASWPVWEWGKTHFRAKEKRHLFLAAQKQKISVLDSVRLEVRQAYLKTMEAEKTIAAVEKAIEQAQENFRISRERYREQMATSTDVLDARTLLSTTLTNYHSALYDFNIARAALEKAMGTGENED
ncbi:conserved exported hypothetical protein [Candidatus Desulfarcum epimagneticum]|uniref:TolC family protein n=1 Tax=uncultured Desulfobacteraceae bacterium TaxID=218296 RepID=A0A484HG45_9BACT|nr:conserved exported hypothetical protein [uncultured Desulfobacteraceae bacterium]